MKKSFLLSVLISSSLSLMPLVSFSQEASQFVITLKTAELQITQAEAAYKAGNLKEAYAMVSKLRPVLSESTELHSQLYNALKDETAAAVTADNEKKQTIEFAKLRDRANYLAGLVSIKSGNQREAVKHLVQVIESQRTTELGEKAYNALRDIGFSPKLNLKDQ
ncbi:MAG: hypothetical protein SFU25_07555 [Candidatus Caenarcaniphilales bacterium]|nr:hypothetical protein [Candidatus Caenarcaniphilales bacterium]